MYNWFEECLNSKELLYLENNTIFSREEIKPLFSRFLYLDRKNFGYLSYTELQMIPEFFANPFRSLILLHIEEKISEYEKMNFAYFLDFLSIFHKDTPKAKRINFLFNIFDLNKDHKLCRKVIKEISKIMGYTSSKDIEKTMEYDISKKGYLDIVDFNRLYNSDPNLDKVMVINFKDMKEPEEPEASFYDIFWSK